jgi:hypothetical protein
MSLGDLASSIFEAKSERTPLLVREADAVASMLIEFETFRARGGASILNVGSQTSEFRKWDQPWVGSLFSKLESSGHKVTHLDINSGDGIDLTIDVLDHAQFELAVRDHDVVFVSNLLEHLNDHVKFAGSLSNVLSPDQLLLLSGPKLFPYHPDPIDNNFRPELKDLINLFEPRLELVNYLEVKEFFYAKSNFMKGKLHLTLFGLALSIVRFVVTRDASGLLGWWKPVTTFVSLWRTRGSA